MMTWHAFRMKPMALAVALAATQTLSQAAFAGETTLAEAIRQGDRAAVASLLKQGGDVNAALGDGTTALHWAVIADDAALVRQLLTAGANPRSSTRIGHITPLIAAGANNNAAIVTALIKAGADPNVASDNGLTPLMAAAAAGSGNVVNALLDAGADPNARERIYGQTALMLAAAKNRASVIGTLVRRGARVGLTSNVTRLEPPRLDEDGNPLPDRKPKAAAQDSAPLTPFAAAAQARRASAQVLGGNTALGFAAREGHLDAVRALIEAGADANQPSAGDQTPPITLAICNGHYDVARSLLDYGADVNRVNADGLAPLYAVIDTQWAPVGWAPNPITDQEATTYLELMRALLDKGANPNAKLTKKLWFRPTHHDELWVGTVGSTAFWRAAQATDIAAMRLLVAHGADVKAATIDGDNALMVAAGLGWNGNFSTQGPNTALDTVRYCLELGIDPTPADVQGYTALAGAAYRGDNELVKLLVSRGAKLDARSYRGWSVTDMANGPSLRSSVPVKHPDTVALLLKLGAPPLTPYDDEEILGIIKRPQPKKP